MTLCLNPAMHHVTDDTISLFYFPLAELCEVGLHRAECRRHIVDAYRRASFISKIEFPCIAKKSVLYKFYKSWSYLYANVFQFELKYTPSLAHRLVTFVSIDQWQV